MSDTYNKNNIFARMLRGEIPNNTVYEDEHVLAFHDIAPQMKVHVLVIPKGAYLDAADFGAHASEDEIVAFTRAISKITAELGLDENGFRLIANKGSHGGQEVPHYHVHILGGAPVGKMVSR
jgi:diadenosine tetraphosphate (Ap4A) HIT family hydrolase